MKLDTFLKSKVRWHLGYNLTSVPAGDQGRLEEALDNIQDSFWYDKIVEQITRCEEAEKRTDMTGSVNNDTTPRNRIETIAGDVDRSVSTSDFKETLKTWTDYYSQLGVEIPQDELGINPGVMSLSEKIDIVHFYGNPDNIIRK